MAPLMSCGEKLSKTLTRDEETFELEAKLGKIEYREDTLDVKAVARLLQNFDRGDCVG